MQMGGFRAQQRRQFRLHRFDASYHDNVRHIYANHRLSPRAKDQLTIGLYSSIMILAARLGLHRVARRCTKAVLVRFRRSFTRLFDENRAHLDGGENIGLLTFRQQHAARLAHHGLNILHFSNNGSVGQH